MGPFILVVALQRGLPLWAASLSSAGHLSGSRVQPPDKGHALDLALDDGRQLTVAQSSLCASDRPHCVIRSQPCEMGGIPIVQMRKLRLTKGVKNEVSSVLKASTLFIVDHSLK